MVKLVTRKAMTIRKSGRSTDFITPSFGHGCLFNCTYCYMKRHKPEGLTIAKNIGDILTAVNNHVSWLGPKVPNQTHKKYWTYDISCNEDLALHAKYHNWRRIFEYFKISDIAFGSFATKYVNKDLLSYNPNKKIRIRFSLMPEKLRKILEPNTSNIQERIGAIPLFLKAGYEVHLNFSPVVVYKGWEDDYKKLFNSIPKYEDVLCEVIFLTHNINKHVYNVRHSLPGENYLFTPNNQEEKQSQFGGKNIRYKRELKKEYISTFKEIHNEIIPWNTIRYIF